MRFFQPFSGGAQVGERVVDFATLVMLQKKIPLECPIRLIPFLNDPLAFMGEPELDEKQARLKACLKDIGAGEDVLAATDASLKLIRQAEKQLEQALSALNRFFSGYECAGRGSLFQTSPTEMKNTLWLEAFRQLGEYELTLQAHVSLDLKPEWAQLLVLSKERKEEMAQAMKFFDKHGWDFKELPGPGNHVYILEKAEPAQSTLEELLKSAREAAADLEKKFSAAS